VYSDLEKKLERLTFLSIAYKQIKYKNLKNFNSMQLIQTLLIVNYSIAVSLWQVRESCIDRMLTEKCCQC